MIFYSILSEEQVFQGLEDLQAPVEITLNGILMQVERLSDSQARIVRIISPVPEHYLNDACRPGTIIQFTPTL